MLPRNQAEPGSNLPAAIEVLRITDRCDQNAGSNRNADGWKMVGFPGCGHDYRNFVGKNVPVSQLVPIQTIRDFRDRP
jgi:hypothetical protein